MRFVTFTFALQLASTCLARPIPPMSSSSLPAREIMQAQQQDAPATPRVLKYSHEKAYTEFSVPYAGCFADDEALLFHFQALANPGDTGVGFILNDHRFIASRYNDSHSLSHSLPVLDVSGNIHAISLYWSLSSSPWPSTLAPHKVNTAFLHFHVASIDGLVDLGVNFTIGLESSTHSPRLTRLGVGSTSNIVRFAASEDTFDTMADAPSPPLATGEGSNTLNIEGELEYLRHLETQAMQLQTQIAAQKAAITEELRNNRNRLCLRQLIRECDGVVCAARVVAQRMCDKLGIIVDPAFGFVNERILPQQQLITSDMPILKQHFNDKTYTIQAFRKPLTQHINDTTYTIQAFRKPLLLTKDDTPSHPIIYILQVLVGALGLTSLWLLIKSKCTSARTKVERAADREERRNRRTYRRAARRALMRKRWDDLFNMLNCFRPKEAPRMEDYEEKRALILQDAFLEQDLDQAEKGEVMEAEIRELRHAHEIVASLVRPGGPSGHGDFLPAFIPVHDPPPPLVPLPYTPLARSRASTHTLPSYTSEVLPDYASRYSRERRRLSGSTIGFTPSTTDSSGGDEDCRSSGSGDAEGGLGVVCQAQSERSGSSVLVTSCRYSAETLRTGRQSEEVEMMGR